MMRIVIALLLATLAAPSANAASETVRSRIADEVFRDCDPDADGKVSRAELVACMGKDDIEGARTVIGSVDETARVATSLLAQSGGQARRQTLIEMLSGAGVQADLLDRIPSREGDLVGPKDIEDAKSAAMAELRDALAPRMQAAEEAADDVLSVLDPGGKGVIARKTRPTR